MKTSKLFRNICFFYCLVGLAKVGAETSLLAWWDFERVEADGVSIKSTNGKYVGTINDAAKITEAGGGRPGGGRGFNVSQANSSRGHILVEATGDDNPMNLAAADDAVSIVLWQKNFSNVNSSSFWFVADSQRRGIQAHVPWSNGHITLDSNGCCLAPSQRLDQAAPDGFDWTTWHHYAFVKNKEAKQIYIDGELLAEQTEGVGPLPTDFTRLFIGSASDKNAPDGIIDDFAIFKGALSQKDIQAIVKGGPIGAPPVDTDKDGMPDTWEVDYGFNPNDPSDAKTDFDKDGFDNLAEYNAGTDPKDLTPPTLARASGSASGTTISLTFSERVDPVTAGTVGNYSVSPALSVTAAAVKGNTVTLTTAKQNLNGTEYTVTVNNIQDLSRNAIVAGARINLYSFVAASKKGVLKLSAWRKIKIDEPVFGGGNIVEALSKNTNYPYNPEVVIPIYESTSRGVFDTYATNYFGAEISSYLGGAILEGILIPIESGQYRFFIYNDDASVLQLSSDNSESNLRVIAQGGACCDPFSEPGSPRTSNPISLTAGKKYLMRLIYKEGGGYSGEVAWRKEGVSKSADSLDPIPRDFFEATEILAVPPEGVLVNVSPPPNAKYSNNKIKFVYIDGRVPQSRSSTILMVDGVVVNPSITKSDNRLSVEYEAVFNPGSKHTASVQFLDASGKPTVYSWQFTTSPLNKTGTLFIEAEDFDFDGGKSIFDQRIGMDGDYTGGSFAGKGGVNGIDFFSKFRTNNQKYRWTTQVGAGRWPPNRRDRNRGNYEVEVDYSVGWGTPGDWQNYTRYFPERKTKYIAFLGQGPGTDSGAKRILSQVVSGFGTAQQNVQILGEALGENDLVCFTNKNTGLPAVFELSGKVTLKVIQEWGGFDYLAFVPMDDENIPAVKIFSQPQSVATILGESIALAVGATNAKFFQWTKDGNPLPGATNATLTFTNVQPTRIGDYRVVVSNGAGSVTSSVATLNIKPKSGS